jgi:hypothetical protein
MTVIQEEQLQKQARNLYAFQERGAEYHLIRQAVIEESGGRLDGMQNVFDVVLNRVASKDYPNTIEAVLKQHTVVRPKDKPEYIVWQFSYWGDQVHPTLTGDQLAAVDALLEPLWVEYVHGEYQTVLKAHSFVTPSAFRTSTWHEKFDCHAVDSAHYHLGGPKRAAGQAVSCLQFIRPQARPADPILLALMEAQK